MSEPVDIIGGVDIGGSHIGIGLYNNETNQQLSLYEENIDNTIPPEELIQNIVKIVKNLQRQLEYKTSLIAMGIGCPGQSKNGVLVAASNFKQWKMVPLAKMLSEQLDNIPTTLINDADAAIAAEVWGTDHYTNVRNAAMITLGTGVGFALILDGRFYSGANGLIEGGHLIIDPNSDRLCGCGQRGCIEVYASAKNAALTMERLSSSTSASSSSANFHPYKATVDGAKGIFQRAEGGDEIANQVLQEVADYLAIFCINICRLVDPEVIIFGGGMAHAGDTLLRSIQESMAKYTWTVYPPTIRLEIAHQVGNAGVMGAALSAQSYYSHLHPSLSHSNPRHDEISNQSPPLPPSPPPSTAPPSFSSPSLQSNELALLGSITATGLIFLYFSSAVSSSPSTNSNSTDLMRTARNIFLFSHTILFGVHLFGMFSKR